MRLGRQSNVILTNEQGIIDSLRRIGISQSMTPALRNRASTTAEGDQRVSAYEDFLSILARRRKAGRTGFIRQHRQHP